VIISWLLFDYYMSSIWVLCGDRVCIVWWLCYCCVMFLYGYCLLICL